MNNEAAIMGFSLLSLFLNLLAIAALVYFFVLLIRVMRKYLKSSDAREKKAVIRKTLGENIREKRVSLKMTQEFVAESLGVSRQAVAKWESGASDPSTSNLIALSRLFQIPADELIGGTEK